MNKISKLTPDQEKELASFYKERLEIGRSTKPVNQENIKKVIGNLYEKIGEKRPTVLVFSSPMMCLLAYGVLKKLIESKKDLKSFFDVDSQLRSLLDSQLYSQLRSLLDSQFYSQLDSQLDSQLRSQLDSQLSYNRFGGNTWLSWIAFLEFGKNIGVNYDTDEMQKLALWVAQYKECHWWFPFKGLVIASDRPRKLKVNETGRLHALDGKAIEYSDGWGFYYSNGISMEEWMIETPVKKLDFQKVVSVANVDQRREIISRVGIDKLIKHIPHRVEDKTNKYELIRLDLSDRVNNRPYLRMINPSTKDTHIEGVGIECKTVQEAKNWRKSKDIRKEWNPCIVT